MQIGAMCFNGFKQVDKKSKIHFRVNAAYYMNFRNGFAIVAFNDVHHLLNA